MFNKGKKEKKKGKKKDLELEETIENGELEEEKLENEDESKEAESKESGIETDNSEVLIEKEVETQSDDSEELEETSVTDSLIEEDKIDNITEAKQDDSIEGLEKKIDVVADNIEIDDNITQEDIKISEEFEGNHPVIEDELPNKGDVVAKERIQSALVTIKQIEDAVNQRYLGSKEQFNHLMVAFLCGGHVLVEGVPGIGKSTLAVALAKSLEVVQKRIQFTPDTTPTDITGYNMFNPGNNEFYFKEGAVFSNILIADEINRTNPRVQAGLLEAMAEKQVSIEGKVYQLPELFLVIATQNPIENFGTYELPEAQLDRFFMKFVIEYLEEDLELDLLKKHDQMQENRKIYEDKITIPQILEIQKLVKTILISEKNYKYIMDIVIASRNHKHIKTGISTRSAIQLVDGVKANALIEGRDYVLPDDVKAIIKPMYNHKLILTDDAKFEGIDPNIILDEIIESVNVPK